MRAAGLDRRAILVVAALALAPLALGDFWLVQILGRAAILGTIALGLTLLAGYGGMVSLAQMTVAGVAGYAMAIAGTAGWPLVAALPTALALALVAAGLVGLLAVRTEGIYTIMITLALAVVFFYFTRQNYAVFNGFNGFAEVLPPAALRAPAAFWWLCLAVAAGAHLAARRLVASPFGLALQGLRDEPRRLRSLGFDVARHRVATYLVAGAMAGAGGVLLTWFNTRIDPATVGVGPVIDILVIAVIGGLSSPVGAFVGALAFVLIDNFAVEVVPAARERFNLIIGLFFLIVLLASPDGLIGIWRRMTAPPHDDADQPR